MVESTLCCGIIPWYYVRRPSDKLARFCLASHPSWDVVISWPKAGYLSSGAREFLRLAQAWWEEQEG